jgi:hypothetical protein
MNEMFWRHISASLRRPAAEALRHAGRSGRRDSRVASLSTAFTFSFPRYLGYTQSTPPAVLSLTSAPHTQHAPLPPTAHESAFFLSLEKNPPCGGAMLMSAS